MAKYVMIEIVKFEALKRRIATLERELEASNIARDKANQAYSDIKERLDDVQQAFNLDDAALNRWIGEK